MLTSVLLIIAAQTPVELAIDGSSRIDPENLRKTVMILQSAGAAPGTPGTRAAGTSGEEAARFWIEAQLRAMGAPFTRQPVRLSHTFVANATVSSENIVAHFGPRNAPRLVVLAHLDSKGAKDAGDAAKLGWSWTSSAAPGADDNASGAAALLELARLLERMPVQPKLGVDLAWTAGEELAIVGEGQWMSNLGAEVLAEQYLEDGVEISGVIAADMMLRARPSEHLFRVYSDGRLGSQRLAVALQHAAAITGAGARVVLQVEPGFTYSDHGAFWARGWPGVLLIEDDFHHPRYHRASDLWIEDEGYYSLAQLHAGSKILWGAVALLAFSAPSP